MTTSECLRRPFGGGCLALRRANSLSVANCLQSVYTGFRTPQENTFPKSAMKKFIVLYHAPKSMMKQASKATPEEVQKSMEGWMKWAAKCGDQLVDMGAPLSGGQHLAPGGTSKNSRKSVTGYSVLQAKSMAGAKRLLKTHPHLKWDASCSIEVHEVMPMPGS